MMQTNERSLQERKKRARWRSWHRGMQEMDIILGRFADAHVETMDGAELEAFEAVLTVEDVELYAWAVKGEPVPARQMSEMLKRILDFKVSE